MIWYDAITLEPVMSIGCKTVEFHWCQTCKTERQLKYYTPWIAHCQHCQEIVLVGG